MGDVRVVQIPLEGTITQLVVKENQTVKRGDIIATIDDSNLQIQKKQFQEAIDQNQLQLTQILAQIDAIDSQQIAEMSLMNRSINAAQWHKSHPLILHW